MEKQTSNAKAILEKLKKAKEDKEKDKEEITLVSVANEVSAGQSLLLPNSLNSPNLTKENLLPPVFSRTFNYWSKAPNTEIALSNLSNRPPIKFKGNCYQTSDSHEISVLDDMVKRIPNVFSKVE